MRHRTRISVSVACLIVAAAFWAGLLSHIGHLLSGGNQNPLQTVLDVGDKVGGIVGGIIAVLSVVRPGRTAIAPAVPIAAGGDGEDADFVDRVEDRALLRRALRSRASRVIVVDGQEGVGKTKLVMRVVGEMGLAMHPHTATPTELPSADTLMQDLIAGGGPAVGSGPPDDDSVLGRLDTALGRYRRQRAVIVIDNAELLLDQDGHLMDLALDEALQAIALARHRVKVVLVTTVPPKPAGTHERWLPCPTITVRGLPFDYFRAIARERAGNSRLAASLDDRRLGMLWRDLGGQLRLAELFDAIADSWQGVAVDNLAAKVRVWRSQDDTVTNIRARLIEELLRTLSPAGRSVYEVLAAFACPVTADEVVTVVRRAGPPGGDVREIRDELGRLSRHVVRHSDGRYFLPRAEAWRALDWHGRDPDEKLRVRRLLVGAAEQLKRRRTQPGRSDRLDRAALFPEIDARLRAGSSIPAYRALRAIDDRADEGRPDIRLRHRREQVAERLSVDLQPANYLILGYLYHAGGDLVAAEKAFQRVLQLGAGVASIEAKARLHLTWLRWSQTDAVQARRGFQQVLLGADDDPVVLASAHEGLARCARRLGQFDEAVKQMEQAYQRTEAGSPKRVSVAARLARLYLDTGRTDDAERLIEHARDFIPVEQGEGLIAIRLDALADVRFTQERFDDALSLARQALELALRQRDSFTALQARLTICSVRLHRRQWYRARREAALAERYRDTERSLIVIAFSAVAAQRQKRYPDARADFDRLLEGARKRLARDGDDFAAWELVGVALCGMHLQPGGPPISEAVNAFTRSRPDGRKPGSGHIRFIAFLVTTTARDRQQRGRLAPVLALLQDAAVLPAAS